MKNLFITVLFLVVSVPSMASADDFNTRPMFHGHKSVTESAWGIAGWVVAPNVTSSPAKWFAIVGPRYDGAGWNIELLTGAIVDSGEGQCMVDARIGLTPELWGIPLDNWWNLQWFDTGGLGKGYAYTRVDYVLPLGIGLVGLETENIFTEDSADWSVAPHAALPLGDHFVLIAAPQFHFNEDGDYSGFQFWTRVLLDF